MFSFFASHLLSSVVAVQVYFCRLFVAFCYILHILRRLLVVHCSFSLYFPSGLFISLGNKLREASVDFATRFHVRTPLPSTLPVSGNKRDVCRRAQVLKFVRAMPASGQDEEPRKRMRRRVSLSSLPLPPNYLSQPEVLYYAHFILYFAQERASS